MKRKRKVCLRSENTRVQQKLMKKEGKKNIKDDEKLWKERRIRLR